MFFPQDSLQVLQRRSTFRRPRVNLSHACASVVRFACGLPTQWGAHGVDEDANRTNWPCSSKSRHITVLGPCVRRRSVGKCAPRHCPGTNMNRANNKKTPRTSTTTMVCLSPSCLALPSRTEACWPDPPDPRGGSSLKPGPHSSCCSKLCSSTSAFGDDGDCPAEHKARAWNGKSSLHEWGRGLEPPKMELNSSRAESRRAPGLLARPHVSVPVAIAPWLLLPRPP